MLSRRVEVELAAYKCEWYNPNDAIKAIWDTARMQQVLAAETLWRRSAKKLTHLAILNLHLVLLLPHLCSLKSSTTLDLILHNLVDNEQCNGQISLCYPRTDFRSHPLVWQVNHLSRGVASRRRHVQSLDFTSDSEFSIHKTKSWARVY